MKKRILFGTTIALAGIAALAGPAARAQDAPAAPTAAPAERTISVDFRNMALRDAVDTLKRGTGVNVVVTRAAAEAVPTITLSLQDVTFETALNILAKTASLRLSKDRDGIYTLDVRAQDTGMGAQPALPAPTPDQLTPTDVLPPLQIEKVPLNYVDPIDMYGALTGQGSNRAGNSMGGGGGFGGGMSGGGFGGGGMGGFGGSGGFGGGGFGGGGMGGFGGGGFGGGGMGGFGGGGFGGGGMGGFGGGSGGFGGGGFGGGGFR